MFEGLARLLHVSEQALPADSAAPWLPPSHAAPSLPVRTRAAPAMRAPSAPEPLAPRKPPRPLKPGVNATALQPTPTCASPVLSHLPTVHLSFQTVGCHPVPDTRTHATCVHIWGTNGSWETEGAGSLRAGSRCYLGKWGPGPGGTLYEGMLLQTSTFPSPPQELSKRFAAIRKTKGDGNCFYRALGYAYLESLLGKSREILK